MALVDGDQARLVALGAGDQERKNAIAVLGLDGFGIDLHRHGQGAIERPEQPFAAMQAYLFRISKLLLPGNADGVVLGLDFEVGLVDARQLDYGDQVVPLLEDVDGRERAAAGRGPAQPFAVEARSSSAL